MRATVPRVGSRLISLQEAEAYSGIPRDSIRRLIADGALVSVELPGIRRVWMQQGAQSDAAIRYCQEHNINEVHGECIMMFAQPVKSFHGFHRGVWKLFGKLPH